ncbi:AAA family ATPase [uncultured Dokdonia sp.]|uniref:AAA family ATPase n=1 Tax=uncultured Dokdonia sp. TaxID=575653 RepID=UPI0026396C85|nr:AAA family ATPase [uncultured Dokdonia sp.]
MDKPSEERFGDFIPSNKKNKIILANLPLKPFYCIDRNELSKHFNETLKSNSIVKVQGIGGSGKSTFINNYCRSGLCDSKNYIWYTCSKSESESDVLNNLYDLNIPITRKSRQIRIRTLIKYLNDSVSVLILDDFDKVDNSQFIELFRSMNQFGDSAKIICISNIDNNEMSGNYDYVKFHFPDGYSKVEVKELLKLKYLDISTIDLSGLFKSTNFLPRLIEYLISSDTIVDFNSKVINNNFTKRVEGWIKLIETKLKASHIKSLICLSHIDGTFPRDMLNFIGSKYNIDNDDLEMSLNKPLVLSEFEDGRLKLNEMVSQYYRSTNDKKNINDIYSTIASYFRGRIKFEPDRLKKLLLSLRSIKYFHLAENYLDAEYVLEKSMKGYKLEGMYEEIIPILNYQIKNSESNEVNWLKYHYAHANFVVGNYEESLTTLRSQLFATPNFNLREGKKIQNIIRFELKIFLLYTELLSTIGQSETAIEIILRKINKIVVQDYSVSELSWQVISNFISNLSWYLIENKEYDKAINILNKLNKSTLLIQKDYSLAINNTRLAVAYFYKEEFTESKRLLELAYEIFDSNKINDKRAKAWACTYFVRLYLVDSQLKFEKSLEEYLRICLEINSDSKLIDLRYFEMLNMLSTSYENLEIDPESDLIQYVEDEKIRQNDLLVNSIEITEKKEFIDITIAILGGLKDNDYDMYSLVNRFLNKKTVRIGGAYFKSFLNNVKHNATRVLAHIFSTKDKSEIFMTPYLNVMITVAIKFDEDGIYKYIIPNIDLISSKTTDSIRLHYVRALSEGNCKSYAIDLLEKIKDRSSEYYNLFGNATSDSNMYESYKNYKIAFDISNSTYDKGRYMNNLAWLIYKNNWKSKYDEAIEYCQLSLKYRKYHYKFWPYAMQCFLLLNIDLTPLEKIEIEFKKIINESNLNVKVKWGIIDKIRDVRKKKIIENFEIIS